MHIHPDLPRQAANARRASPGTLDVASSMRPAVLSLSKALDLRRIAATRDLLLRSLIAAGHGLGLIQNILGLERLVLIALARTLCLADPLDTPVRPNRNPRAWRSEDYYLMAALWLDNERVGVIAELTGRSKSSIYAKRRLLNLPRRDRRTLKPAVIPGSAEPEPVRTETPVVHPRGATKRKRVDPADLVLLTYDEAIRIPVEQRRGFKWQVRNSPIHLVMTLKAGRPQIDWKGNTEAQRELGYRYLAGQSAEGAADDLGATAASVRTIWSQMGLTRRNDITYTAHYDHALAVHNIHAQHCRFSKDLNMSGWHQWIMGRNGIRVSRKFKQSVRYRQSMNTDACDVRGIASMGMM